MSGPYSRYSEKSRFRQKAEENPLVAVGLGASFVTFFAGGSYIKRLRKMQPGINFKVTLPNSLVISFRNQNKQVRV